MGYIIYTLAVLALIVFPPTTTVIRAEAPTPPPPTKEEIHNQLKQKSVTDLIEHFAEVYNANPKVMYQVMKCESGFNEHAIGDHGTSYGLSQIHLPAHKSITKEQATDKVFAVEFMAREIGNGNARIWTCARQLGYT